MKRTLVALSIIATSVVTALPAHATAKPTLVPIADGLVGPLQIAVDDDAVYVAQDFIGVLTRLDEEGARTDIASNPGGELAGVDVRDHRVFYTTGAGEDPNYSGPTGLQVLTKSGSRLVADTSTTESTQNPDAINTYGFEQIPAECAAQWPVDFGPPTYQGIVDSHPYAVASTRGRTYVADAAGNNIWEVTDRGSIRSVAVLPPRPLLITAAIAASQGLPDCTVGLTYDFEPVPTDVEVGRDGMLYVSGLDGGPEDPSLGARSAIYRINPKRGTVTIVAQGLAGATNLALDGRGGVYVAELFGGRISKVTPGGLRTIVEVPNPAAVEWSDGSLYVAYDVFGDGKVARLDL